MTALILNLPTKMSSCVFLFGVLSTVMPGLAQKVAGGWFSIEKRLIPSKTV